MVVSFGLGNEWDPQSPQAHPTLSGSPKESLGPPPTPSAFSPSCRGQIAARPVIPPPPPATDLLVKSTPLQGGAETAQLTVGVPIWALGLRPSSKVELLLPNKEGQGP